MSRTSVSQQHTFSATGGRFISERLELFWSSPARRWSILAGENIPVSQGFRQLLLIWLHFVVFFWWQDQTEEEECSKPRLSPDKRFFEEPPLFQSRFRISFADIPITDGIICRVQTKPTAKLPLSPISVDENVPFICTNVVFLSLSLSAIADHRWGMSAL